MLSLAKKLCLIGFGVGAAVMILPGLWVGTLMAVGALPAGLPPAVCLYGGLLASWCVILRLLIEGVGLILDRSRGF